MKKFINYCYLAIIAIVMMACGGISPELDQLSGEENGHGYMDLGLSVMWAQVNLGASMIGEYGDYYAWGEQKLKTTSGIIHTNIAKEGKIPIQSIV